MELAPALIGFVGVIVTLVVNAWLGRRAQQKQWNHEQDRRNEQLIRERIALRSAFLGELKVSLQNTRGIVQAYEEAIKSRLKSAVIPVAVSDDVYRNAIARIGLLSEPEIRKIADAYVRLRGRREILRTLNDKTPRSDHFVVVSAQKIPDEIAATNNMIAFIEGTVSLLERGLDIDLPMK